MPRMASYARDSRPSLLNPQVNIIIIIIEACTHVHMHTRTHARTHAHMHTRMHAHTHMHACMHACTHMHVHTQLAMLTKCGVV